MRRGASRTVTTLQPSASFAARLDPYRQNRIAYRLLRFAYRFADVVVTLTEGARRDLARNFHVPETGSRACPPTR